MLVEADVLEILKQVQDPEHGRDIVALGYVKNLKVVGSDIRFDLEFPLPDRPERDQILSQCFQVLKGREGIRNVNINKTFQQSQTASRPASNIERNVLPNVRYVIAVASGKGGVGKSTVAVNLALALAKQGHKVGLLDADIYGPSAPTMFGTNDQPEVDPSQQIMPVEKYGIKLMSMGFLSTDDSPVIWRGPMVHGILQQFLTRVVWGALDYLVIDLPPGTGDAQLTLTQSAPLSGAVIVTTPQEVSLIDARKGLKMFQKVNVPVLGIVENMSYFVCPDCNNRSHIFKSGGGKKTAHDLNVPLLSELPIDPDVSESGDQGKPIVMAKPDSITGKAYLALAAKVVAGLNQYSAQASGIPPNFKMTWKTVPS